MSTFSHFTQAVLIQSPSSLQLIPIVTRMTILNHESYYWKWKWSNTCTHLRSKSSLCGIFCEWTAWQSLHFNFFFLIQCIIDILTSHETYSTFSNTAKGEGLGVFISQTRVKLTDKHDYLQVQHAERRWHSKLLVNTRHHPRSTISYKVWDSKWVVVCVCAIVQYCYSLILQYVLITLSHQQTTE